MYLSKIVLASMMVFLPSPFAYSTSEASAYPTYNIQNGILTIPRVDTDAQAGYFQDVRIKFQPDGALNLESYTTNADTLAGRIIDKVELIKTNTVPVQVFLKVTGDDMGCEEFGQIDRRLIGNRFEVAMYIIPRPADTVCAAVIVPFEKTVPLEIYGLPAGSYETVVNGSFTNTFELTVDNKL